MTTRTLDSQQRALDLAFRYLDHRDRTIAEVRRCLEGKRVDPATIDATVAELSEGGYLDDARYARRFAEDRRALDHWGAERIERRLLALGVDRDLVASALAEQDGRAELEAAVAFLHRRLTTPPHDDRGRNRALEMLARKGYELELAHAAVRAFERGE
jgi:regulatory protein